MSSFFSFALAAAFIVAVLGLLAYCTNFVIGRLLHAAANIALYRDYRLFVSRRNTCVDQQEKDFYPVPVAPYAAMRLHSLAQSGIKVCGLVLELNGKTFELYTNGQQVQTGLLYNELTEEPKHGQR